MPEVRAVSERLRHDVSSNIPALKAAAEYFFRPGVEGKRLRPTLCLLMASALSSSTPGVESHTVDLRPASTYAPELRRRQQRVAEIAEMIHVASLMHDDVLDDSATRRGIMSLNASQGNKIAILAGAWVMVGSRSPEDVMCGVLTFFMGCELVHCLCDDGQWGPCGCDVWDPHILYRVCG